MGELDPRIRIRAPLRCDGIGRLDCAEDAESGVRLAVRWLPLDANGETAAQACQKLPHHPTLPRIRHTGTVGAFSYVAMDFPEGELLAAREGETLPPQMLLWLTAQIADALATIHSQDVFHGEMSAESILLVKPEKAEKAFLWDMPLVIANRLTDRRGEERLMHQLVRTAAYLAPERARGQKPNGPADVYGLGAIICIAGGAVKPVCDTTLGLVHQVATGAWIPKVPRSLPEPMRSMLERMVQSDAKARPTAREVADLFAPPAAVSSSPTLREMPALHWPPVPSLAPLAPAGPRPSLPPLKGPSSWTAIPAVTSAPASAVFAAPVLKPFLPAPELKETQPVPMMTSMAMMAMTPAASTPPAARAATLAQPYLPTPPTSPNPFLPVSARPLPPVLSSPAKPMGAVSPLLTTPPRLLGSSFSGTSPKPPTLMPEPKLMAAFSPAGADASKLESATSKPAFAPVPEASKPLTASRPVPAFSSLVAEASKPQTASKSVPAFSSLVAEASKPQTASRPVPAFSSLVAEASKPQTASKPVPAFSSLVAEASKPLTAPIPSVAILPPPPMLPPPMLRPVAPDAAPTPPAEPSPSAPPTAPLKADPPRHDSGKHSRLPSPPMVDALTRATAPALPAASVASAPSVAELEQVPEAAPEDVMAEPTAPVVNVSVALTENLSVSSELVDEGAKALSQTEVVRLQRQKVLPWALAGVATLVVGVLAAVAISMASSAPRVRVVAAPKATVAPRAPVQVEAVVPEQPAVESDDELLAAPTRAKRAAHRTWVKPVEQAPAKPAAKDDSDFSFLEESDAPLKRPTF